MGNYTEKTVYLGIDVHKNFYVTTAISDGQVVKRDRLVAEPAILQNYLTKHFPGKNIVSAYEAGFCGFPLHRSLTAFGIHNMVVHPASIEVSARNRVKTDKRDSLKIATQLSAGRLASIFVPSEKRERYRMVTRLRDTLVIHKKRLNNQLKSFLFLCGETVGEKRTSLKWIKEILDNCSSDEKGYCKKLLAEMWMNTHEKIKSIDKELELQATEDHCLESIYKSLPGFGAVIARSLANELGDMSQFSSEKKLFSFTGLTPSEHSSGEHKRQGHISRQGRSNLRRMLVQAAWVAIEIDGELREIFDNLSRRTGPKRAIVAIARRLIGRARSCVKRGEKYKLKRNQKTDKAVTTS